MTNKKRLGLAMPSWIYEELKSESEYTGQTLNALVLEILREWLKKNKDTA